MRTLILQFAHYNLPSFRAAPYFAMPGTRRKSDSLLYPPLTPEFKARIRKAGHADMIHLLDNVSASTIRGLMKAAPSGPMFKPRKPVKTRSPSAAAPASH